jgi:hypothetical protein
MHRPNKTPKSQTFSLQMEIMVGIINCAINTYCTVGICQTNADALAE